MSTANLYETGMEILMESMTGFEEPVLETDGGDIEPILDPAPLAEYPKNLTDKEIHARLAEISTEIESLPAPVKFNGYAFSWREERHWQEAPKLKIVETKQPRWEFSLRLGTDGNILDYSFYSPAGRAMRMPRRAPSISKPAPSCSPRTSGGKSLPTIGKSSPLLRL